MNNYSSWITPVFTTDLLRRCLSKVPVIASLTLALSGPTIAWAADFDLIPGEYRYFFIVDGSVTVDGGTGRVVQDDFGGVTGVLTVHQTPEGVLKTF